MMCQLVASTNEDGSITTIDGATYCELYYNSQVIKPYKTVHLLKTKNDVTCAVIESNAKLMVIRGGQIKNIKITNVNNLLSHLDEIYLTCFPIVFHRMQILEQLSSFIQENGGRGRVHGNIVDIDFENHIVLFKNKIFGYTSSVSDWHNGRTIHCASSVFDLLPASNKPIPFNLLGLMPNMESKTLSLSRLPKNEKANVDFYSDNYSALALQESIEKRNMTIIPDWFTDHYQWSNIVFDFKNFTNEELFTYMIEHEQCCDNNLLMPINE